MRLFNKTKFNFLNKTKFTTVMSCLLIILGVVSLTSKGGPRLSIDFTGGTIIQLKFDDSMEISDLRDKLKNSSLPVSQILEFGNDTEYILRIFKNKKIDYIISNEFLCFMRLGGLSTNFRFMMKKIIEDLKIYLTFFGKKKFILIYLKKIFIKVKQFGNIRGREIHNKLLLVLLKKIN